MVYMFNLSKLTKMIPLFLLILFSSYPARALNISLRPLQGGFQMPVHLTAAPKQPEIFVVEQKGRIYHFLPGKRQPILFLDIRDRVVSGGEMGLLSLAFAPDFQRSGRFFLNYTTGYPLKTRIAEWRANPRTLQVIPGSEQIILEIFQPYRNHNGGQLAFGPDEQLYIGTGDGGSANDPHGYAQNLNTLLGKILRIDIRQGRPYRIPTDNPFVGQAGRRPEIWAYGLRNPWRFSFDRKTGALWAGDVGQNRFEEINLIHKGGNYGWNIREGFVCFSPPNNCRHQGLQPPLISYDHRVGNSVTGGFVYRGQRYPALQGIYLYGDFGSGNIWGLKHQAGKVSWNQLLHTSHFAISSFGEDSQGELYLLDYSKGQVYHIEARN